MEANQFSFHDQGPLVSVLQGKMRSVVEATCRWNIIVEYPGRELQRVDLVHDLRAPFDAGRRPDESGVVDMHVADVCVEATVHVIPENGLSGKLSVWRDASGSEKQAGVLE